MSNSTTLFQSSPEEIAEAVFAKIAATKPGTSELTREQNLLLTLPRLTAKQAGLIIGVSDQTIWQYLRSEKLTRHGTGAECLSTREVFAYAKARNQLKGDFTD